MKHSLATFALALCSIAIAADNDQKAADWIPLFNGQNLDGWTPKFAQSPLGENLLGTFRVEDGILKAEYENWESFGMRFGHLYSNAAYSSYILQLEFKLLPFTPLPDAPVWTARNSGVMLHAQSPLTLTLDQGFPVSIEGQFLAEGTGAGTQNGNVVTPGTHIEINGALTTAHIVNATAPLPALDQWVTFEAEVRANELFIFRVDGEEVLRFERPILDEGDPDAQRLLAAGANRSLSSGHIALQAEGHPVWFRNIRIKPLDE